MWPAECIQALADTSTTPHVMARDACHMMTLAKPSVQVPERPSGRDGRPEAREKRSHQAQHRPKTGTLTMSSQEHPSMMARSGHVRQYMQPRDMTLSWPRASLPPTWSMLALVSCEAVKPSKDSRILDRLRRVLSGPTSYRSYLWYLIFRIFAFGQQHEVFFLGARVLTTTFSLYSPLFSVRCSQG